MSGQLIQKCRQDPRSGRRREACECTGNRHRWLCRVYVGRSGATASGDRGQKYRSKQVIGTRREAEAELRRMLAQRDAGTLPQRTTRDTVETFLERWLGERQNIRPRTLSDYRHKLRLYVLPSLGMIRLKELSAGHVRQLIASMTTGRGDKPLSARTVRYVVGIIRHALDVAAAQGLIPFNPLANKRSIELPSYQRRPVRYLGPEEVIRFLDATASDRLAAFWRLMVMTGLRPSEALALQWQDLSARDATVTVRRSLQPDGTFAAPKTASGRRTLTLDAATLAVLKVHREQRAMAEHAIPRPSAMVFATVTGRPLDISNLTKRCRRLCAAAGVPEVPLYGLRHSNATLLLATGIAAKVASERLGHSTVKLTLDTYTHVTTEMEREATGKIRSYEEAMRQRRVNASDPR